MTSVKPVYLIILALAVLLVIYLKVSNPYQEYSTKSFWEKATLSSVSEIPDEALKAGNRNGPVIMWAAIGSSNPRVLKALIDRGADVNESDGIFRGTPLTGAAGYTKNPQMIAELINLGANINKTVHNGETALMIAARYNDAQGIISILIQHGAELEMKNVSNETALDLAKKYKNETAIRELKQAKSKI